MFLCHVNVGIIGCTDEKIFLRPQRLDDEAKLWL